MRARDPMFDIAKFIAILMVVFGHVQTASEMTWGAPYIKNFIIGVNMPLFFAISGYFVRRMDANGGWRYLIVRIAKLLWPALLASVFFCAVKISLSANIEVSPVNWLWGKFTSFWFIWVLSYCILICFFVDNVRFRGGGFIFFVALMFVPSERMYADKILQMLPYFMLGRYLLGDVVVAIKRLPGLGITSLFAYVLIISLSGNVYDNGMGFYWNHVSLYELASNASSVIFWIARLGTAVLGIVSCLYLFDLLARFSIARKLSHLGTTTLGVYILHQDILSWVIKPFLCQNPMFVLVISMLLFIFCHLIVIVSKKVNIINILVWELPRKAIGACNK